MTKLRIPFIAVVVGVFAPVLFAQTGTPVDAVKQFYAYDMAHHSQFTRSSIDARKRWFSDALYKLFLYELKREKEFLKEHPNEKTYFAEGLPFQPIDETCKVGRTELHKKPSFKADAEDKDMAAVRVTFAFPPPCKGPDNTNYTIKLVRSTAGWVIDDVVYEEGQSLVQDLNRKEY